MGRSIRDIEILGPMESEYAKGIGCDVNSQVSAWRDACCTAMQWFFVSIAFYKSSSLDECNEKYLKSQEHI